MNSKIKIARIATVPNSLNCLHELLEEMEKENFEIHLISNFSSNKDSRFDRYTKHHIEIEREISLKNDIKATFQLFKIFRKEQFDIVHSHTPKAGLLVAIASFLARIPIRIHTFTGQVWANYSILKKIFFIMLDRIVSELNTINYVDGIYQREFLIRWNAARADKLKVIGKGSHYGLNINRFKADPAIVSELREKLGLNDKFVIGYLGRLNKDKGISELIKAYEEIKKDNFKLLLVGPIENIPEDEIEKIKNDKDIIWIDYVKDVPNYLSLMSVFVFPSKREGFPLSVLEASLIEIPVVVSHIYGNIDTVIDNETGFFFSSRDLVGLKEKISYYSKNDKIRVQHGKNGKNYVISNFFSKPLIEMQIHDYLSIATKKTTIILCKYFPIV